MTNKDEKSKLMKDFGKHEQDTGSVEVQIALLTERINELNKHFKAFPQDKASRTGLMKMVGRRRRFLRYLREKNKSKYDEITQKLNIRK